MPPMYWRPIPAGAGLNRWQDVRTLVWLADPRRRGAQPVDETILNKLPYRSPQARGSTVLIGGERGLDAPIPAGAGLNRVSFCCLIRDRPDPRRRGAQPCERVIRMSSPARSPQARGSTVVVVDLRLAQRPIPAGAGLNRSLKSSSMRTSSDPRRRGAQPAGEKTSMTNARRSPQARGSTGASADQDAVLQPIPAGAGLNRPRSHLQPIHRPDPRRRGAQPGFDAPETSCLVRSPQARGSTASTAPSDTLRCPIPAGAGLNRSSVTSARSRASDPRRRGAQPSSCRRCTRWQPRSPQARGSTGSARRHRRRTLPIPAGAGLNRPIPLAAMEARPDPRRRGAQPTLSTLSTSAWPDPRRRGAQPA